MCLQLSVLIKNLLMDFIKFYTKCLVFNLQINLIIIDLNTFNNFSFYTTIIIYFCYMNSVSSFFALFKAIFLTFT